jgi:hypothetical protein
MFLNIVCFGCRHSSQNKLETAVAKCGMASQAEGVTLSTSQDQAENKPDS